MTNTLSTAESKRYHRHLLLPEIEVKGQVSLKQSKVLLVGAGGLGSSAALYLAAAGIGTIGIVDVDKVELSNLQRQIIHQHEDLDRPKVNSAKDRILAINPHIQVVPYQTWLSSRNCMDIIKNYDIVVDGSDNFATRYLINDSCVELNTPDVYGSIFRFTGQITVFHAENGPCYRCFFPEAPPADMIPSCSESGVLASLPGLIGLFQATEVLKLILNLGDSLIGRVLSIDILPMQCRQFHLHKDPSCVVCGKGTQSRSQNSIERKKQRMNKKKLNNASELSVTDLKAMQERGDTFLLIDVREAFEFDRFSIPGSTLIPLDKLKDKVNDLDPKLTTIVHCKTGNRSAQAVEFLQRNGFNKVKHLRGGILAWADEIDPSIKKY